MQHQRRLPGSARADQEQSPVFVPEAAGMQRHQALRPCRQHIDRELEELIADVIGVTQHFASNHDQRRTLLRCQRDEACAVHRATENSRPGQRSHRRRLAGAPRRRAFPAEHKSHAKSRGDSGEPMRGESRVRRTYDLQQRSTVRLKIELASQQVQPLAPGRGPVLAEGIGRRRLEGQTLAWYASVLRLPSISARRPIAGIPASFSRAPRRFRCCRSFRHRSRRSDRMRVPCSSGGQSAQSCIARADARAS